MGGLVAAIAFTKMSGSGNDFILIDNRQEVVEKLGIDAAEFARRVCRRRLSVGADGLILVEPADGADFKWRFYNADGSLADMCGNGARCVARFARLNGIAGAEMTFLTGAGPIRAAVSGDRVRVRLSPPGLPQIDRQVNLDSGPLTCSAIDTGVPHLVLEVEDLEAVDVVGLGRTLRYHPDFAPAGTNVNFVRQLGGDAAAIRTYERGVEDETLACGTGSAAAALVLAHKFRLASPIQVHTRGGTRLTIHFEGSPDAGRFEEVDLEGDARIVYRAELGDDAWRED